MSTSTTACLRAASSEHSSATPPECVTTVHLVDGRIVEEANCPHYRPGGDVALILPDGNPGVVAANCVRSVIRRRHACADAACLAWPQFDVRLSGGTQITGSVRSIRRSVDGLVLRGCMAQHEALVYVAYASLESLAVRAPPAPAVAVAAAPRPAADGAAARAWLLRGIDDVRRYLDAVAVAHSEAVDLADLEAAPTDAEETVLYALAARLHVPIAAVAALPSPPPAAQALPAPILRRFGVLPLVATQDALAVAMSDPANQELTAALGFLTHLRIVPVLASSDAIAAALSRGYDRADDEALLRTLGIPQGAADAVERDAERMARERPVVKLVEDFIGAAIHRRASDIHVRPGAQDVELLYRIDGELVPVRRFLRNLLPVLIGRIKVMGSMNLAEHRLPQDGRVTLRHAGQEIDVRISLLPTVHGEAAVLRLLNVRDGLRRLDDVGFSVEDAQRMRDALSRNHGMVLVTGPTGCGKSTTLYAALLELKKENLNILTVEDPVEYRIPGIEQVQVNRNAGVTFARTLRNILRHDPDVIMVGEIRDGETAQVAVESALTGHLVLSTLHTNSAATAVTRLLDLGVEPFLLRSTLLAVLAQRLARRNCEHCSGEERVPDHLREVMGVRDNEVFRAGRGCVQCDGTGVHGRVAVYELLDVDVEQARLIGPDADAGAIQALALRRGMRSITSHAVALARAGTISLGEAFRVRVE